MMWKYIVLGLSYGSPLLPIIRSWSAAVSWPSRTLHRRVFLFWRDICRTFLPVEWLNVAQWRKVVESVAPLQEDMRLYNWEGLNYNNLQYLIECLHFLIFIILAQTDLLLVHISASDHKENLNLAVASTYSNFSAYTVGAFVIITGQN